MKITEIIDSLLQDYLPARYRRVVHLIVLLAMLAAAIVLFIQSQNGDWKGGILALLGAIYAASNRANTGTVTPSDPTPLSENYGSLGGEPYEVSGNDR